MTVRSGVGKRHLAKVHFRDAKELKAVDDAAKAREIPRSAFMRRAALKEARRIMQGRALDKAS